MLLASWSALFHTERDCEEVGSWGPSQRLAATLRVANTQNNSGLNHMLNFSRSKTQEGPCTGYVLCSTGPENQLLSSCCTFHSQGPRTAAGVLAVTSMSQEGMRGPSPLKVTGGNMVSPARARGASRGTCVLTVSCLGDGCWASKMVAAPQPLVIQGAPRM